jgi:hypothetical protein
MQRNALLVALTLATILCPNGSRAQAAAPRAAATLSTSPIPGPRTCFWYRGPHNADPYINVAYPDEGAFYWSANVTVPAGATLRIKGQYPHARYISFVSYRSTGQAVESLADHQIAPDAGSTNPYLPGADRTAKQRSYSITIDTRANSIEAGDGKMRAGDGANRLLAPQIENGSLSILYRIYVNDKAHPVTGGVPLPAAELTLADGRTLTGESACNALNSRQAWNADITSLGIPLPMYRALKDQKDRPSTWPAHASPEWHVQHPRPAVATIFTGDHSASTARGGGEFYPNPDNRYARALISTKFGPVLILRGKMPVTPTTFNGDRKMGTGQLRYWSLCSNIVMINSRVVDCLFDEQVPLDAARNYTIIASKAKDRPRNARPECGLAWVELPEHGDGIGDPDFSLLAIRNMLAAPDFAGAVQNALDDKDLPQMGEYLPKGQYVMPNVVESLFPCPLPTRD